MTKDFRPELVNVHCWLKPVAVLPVAAAQVPSCGINTAVVGKLVPTTANVVGALTVATSGVTLVTVGVVALLPPPPTAGGEHQYRRCKRKLVKRS